MIQTEKQFKILVINPGSTSTKIALYENERELFSDTLRHTSEELGKFPSVYDQLGYRLGLIDRLINDNNINIGELDAVIARGGLVRPIPSGVYIVDRTLEHDLIHPPQGEHASNLGGLIAKEIAQRVGVDAFIADPVVVDEMEDVAHISGHPLFKRRSIFHALNQKAVARGFAKSAGRGYTELNLIVAHLGGGISVGAHKKGVIVDVNNALDGEGPFSPERSGTLPAGDLAKLCFSGEYTYEQVKKMINGQGGLTALAGTNDTREIIRQHTEGSAQASLLLDALVYNIAKYIGSMATVLEGKVDAILITGGIAYNEFICGAIKKRVRFIAPVTVIPGEDEMAALASNALGVLSGEIPLSKY